MKSNASLAYNVFLLVGDFLALITAFVVAYILRVTLNHTPISQNVHAFTYLNLVAALLPFFLLTFALLGLYNARVHEKRFSELGRLFVGCFIGVMAVISYGYVANVQIFPARLVMLYGFLLAFCFVLFLRAIARGLRRLLFNFGIGIANVLIVGDAELTAVLLNTLADARATGYRVVGIVGCDPKRSKSKRAIPCFEDFEAATSALSSKIDTIIQTELYSADGKNDAVLVYAQEHHLDYRFVPGGNESYVGNIEVELFHSVPMITVHQTALTGWGRVVKRAMDVSGSSMAIVLASPIILITALVIKLQDGGPVFYRQTRLTRGDREFRAFKFRSNNLTYNGLTPEEAFAKMGKPELAIEFRKNGNALPNDPRVTPVGHVIRRLSIDELPQLFNVFAGDISLVGPRALVPRDLAAYKKRHVILSVKSGITGLAQVSGRNDIGFDERRKLDLYYVQNWNVWSDIIIMIRTVWVVLTNRYGAS